MNARPTSGAPFFRVLFLALALPLGACGGGGGGGGAPPIDPSDPDALTQAIQARIGGLAGQRTGGNPPPASGAGTAPVVDIPSAALVGEAGKTVNVPVNVTTDDSTPDVCSIYMQIQGALSHFRVNLGCPTAQAKASAVPGKALSQFQLSIDLPANLLDGTFCVNIAGEDEAALVSNTDQVCVTIGEPDEGPLTINGVWVLDDPAADLFPDTANGFPHVVFIGEDQGQGGFVLGTFCENGLSVEVGTFDWTASTGAYTQTSVAEFPDDTSAAECGFNDTTLNGGLGGSVVVNLQLEDADTLIVGTDDGPVPAQSMPSVAGQFVGTWFVGDQSEAAYLNLFPDGTFLLIVVDADSDALCSGLGASVQRGTFSVNPSSGALTVSNIEGASMAQDCGLANPQNEQIFWELQGSSLVQTNLDDPTDDFSAVKITFP